jgi:hypothetical protein
METDTMISWHEIDDDCTTQKIIFLHFGNPGTLRHHFLSGPTFSFSSFSHSLKGRRTPSPPPSPLLTSALRDAIQKTSITF